MRALGIGFEGERVVFKPNVTIGERLKDPGSGITTHPAFVYGLIETAQELGAGRTYILEGRLIPCTKLEEWAANPGFDLITRLPGDPQ